MLDPAAYAELETAMTRALFSGSSSLLGRGEALGGLARHVSWTADRYALAETFAQTSVADLVRDCAAVMWFVPGGAEVMLTGTALAQVALVSGLPLLASRDSWRRAATGPDAPGGGLRVPHVPTSATQGVLALLTAAVGGGLLSTADIAKEVLWLERQQGVLGSSRVRVARLDPSAVATSPTRAAEATPALPTTAPATAADLLRTGELVGSDPSEGVARASSRILLQEVTKDGVVTGVIVTIPGTQTFSTGGPNPADGQSDLELAAGERSAAQAAVEEVLTAAGVSSTMPLLLVGHSQGGMVASALAADPQFRQRFNPVATLTAGSPVANVHVPSNVQEYHAEHRDDVVPGLDADDNPDRSWETTVTDSTPRGFQPHDIEGYATSLEREHRQGEPSVRAWETSPNVKPFLDGPGVTVTSHLYGATRAQVSAH